MYYFGFKEKVYSSISDSLVKLLYGLQKLYTHATQRFFIDDLCTLNLQLLWYTSYLHRHNRSLRGRLCLCE